MPNAVRLLSIVTAAMVMSGCAGKVDYSAPQAAVTLSNTKIIDAPRDKVWDAFIPALSKDFFVVNTIDKSSGLINISFSGDPEKYIDCGRIVSFVKNARGERTYDFPAAQAQMQYEVMDPNGLFLMNRKMELEGRVNLVVEAVSPRQTRVTASARYIVTRKVNISSVNGTNSPYPSETINFNSGQGAAFPVANQNTSSVRCVATGQLEQALLLLAR